MKKYLFLVIYILIIKNSFAQIIIGDLQIEPTANNNEIKVTNISYKTIDKIMINGSILPIELRTLKPDESRVIRLNPKSLEQQRKEDKEARALKELGINK